MASTSTHHYSRSSGSSVSSTGSSYQMILDHVLTYPGSYEIPLRTMYTLNCGPRGTTQPSTPSSSSDSSPHFPQAPFFDPPSTQSLTDNLMAQLSQLPNQSASLPPSFITAFLQRCFPAELPCVDFPQALTGLDYLKDLEMRRRREVAAAMNRMAIDRDALSHDGSALADKYPGVLQWVKSIEDKERKIDALYTQLYVGLRRWILINELSLLPFHKHNCVAMLNTLYPPGGISDQAPPTSMLTSSVLKTQRDGFFKYIQAVQKSGPRILTNLMQQGAAVTDENGWAAVVRTLSMYLQVANGIITECLQIADLEDFSSSQKNRDSGSSRHVRKADSGVSFGSTASADPRPSTRSSEQELPSPVETSRPKTPSGSRPGTALERIARGLRSLGRSRTDVTEMIYGDQPPFPTSDKPRILRKMRSLGSLSDRKSSNFGNRQGSDSPAFNVQTMRKLRADYEARQQTEKPPSNQ